MLIAAIGKWMEKKENELEEKNTLGANILANIMQITEGFFIGAVFMYPILLAGCYYWRKKAENK